MNEGSIGGRWIGARLPDTSAKVTCSFGRCIELLLLAGESEECPSCLEDAWSSVCNTKLLVLLSLEGKETIDGVLAKGERGDGWFPGVAMNVEWFGLTFF